MKTRRPLQTRPRLRLARLKAAQILQESGVRRPPVPVERIVERAGATIRYAPFAGRVSGLVQRTPQGSIIGVNSLHPVVRQRFTIAHELGHLLLQREDLLHVDEAFPVAFRREHAADEHSPYEVEANHFAAELLMPQQMLVRDVIALPGDMDVDEAISRLAKQYGVSEQAMTIRLSALGILK